MRTGILTLIFGLTLLSSLHAQRWLEPADTLNPKRFWFATSGGTAIYTGVSIGLYELWYKNFELTSFHSFDDRREWLQMDKAGHWVTAYQETKYLFDGARWTGLDRRRSRWLGAAGGMLLQSTVEFMDGHSAKWGFSWSDMAFNTVGVGSFVAQDILWQEQRILFKISSNQRLPNDLTVLSENGQASQTLRERQRALYGSTLPERFFKDYNAMTLWASVNISSFTPNSRWPRWLNVAGGYGAHNLYGGFENEWLDDDNNLYRPSELDLPRQRQYYLALDVDLTRIPTKKRWVKTTLSVLNFLKFPAPTLEYTQGGRLRLLPLYF